MFTIEFDEDETCITILDTTGELEDVTVFLYDDYCFIRQWNEEGNRFDLVALKPQMYLKLMEAWRLPEGAYDLDENYNK